MRTSTESNRPLAIYVTHNRSLITMKGIALKFRQQGFQEPSLFFFYENDSYQIQLNQGANIDVKPAYTSDEFCQFLKQNDIKRVCCDINLGSIGGSELTQETHRLIINSRAEQLVLFTSTDEAKPDARRYFENQHRFQLPMTAKMGCIKYRSEIASVTTLESLYPIISPKIIVPQFSTKPLFQAPEPRTRHFLLRWFCSCCSAEANHKVSPKNSTSITADLSTDVKKTTMNR